MEEISGLDRLPQALKNQEKFYPAYRIVSSAIAIFTLPIAMFTSMAILRRNSNVLKTYRVLMVLTLFWSTLAVLLIHIPAKTVVAMPVSVLVNLGPTARFGPDATAALFAACCTCIISTAQTIWNSFAFNFALVKTFSKMDY